MKWAGATIVAASVLKPGPATAGAGKPEEKVVDETPGEVFLHGSGMHIPH